MHKTLANNHSAPIGNLQHLGFQAFMPHPALAAWVQCYWIMRQPVLPDTGYLATLYPDGGSSLSFYFSPYPLLPRFSNSQTRSTVHLSGPQDVISIRFYPGGAFGLLGPDAVQLTDTVIDATDLAISSLQQQLCTTEQISERLHFIEQWLLEQKRRQHIEAGLVQHLLPLLQPQHKPSVTALSAAVNLSKRQFERIFLRQTGLTARQLKLLLRVRCARQLINLKPEQTLTDIALCSGFYDQAHFIHQFQRITGQSPGQYRKRKQTQQMSQKYNSV